MDAVTTFLRPVALISVSSARLAAELSVLIANSFGVFLDATGTSRWRTGVMRTTNAGFNEYGLPMTQAQRQIVQGTSA
jgi:hypothetical protein